MSELFHNTGFTSAGFLNLSAREAYAEALYGTAVIVDVRSDYALSYLRTHFFIS